MFAVRFLCFLISIGSSVSCLAQNDDQKFNIVSDLGKEWKMFTDDGWQPWSGQSVKTIYLDLQANVHQGEYLKLRSLYEMDVFVNRKLVVQLHSGVILLSIDSLARKYSSPLSISIYQKEKIELLFSGLMTVPLKNSASENDIPIRKENVFLNFSILAFLLLAITFVLLFRTNPRLTLDYLNIPRLFSIQEREGDLLTTRVTASVNLLFYLFCSACCAFCLLSIFYLGADKIGGAHYFPIRSTAEGFLQWTKIIVIIAVAMVLKLALIYSCSTMFKLGDTAALQFFNFIRMLFFIVMIIFVVSLISFIYNGYPSGPAFGLLKISMVVMSVSVIMIFLKIMTVAPFRFFHLFSYLWASEIIPLVILLRVLLY